MNSHAHTHISVCVCVCVCVCVLALSAERATPVAGSTTYIQISVSRHGSPLKGGFLASV